MPRRSDERSRSIHADLVSAAQNNQASAFDELWQSAPIDGSRRDARYFRAYAFVFAAVTVTLTHGGKPNLAEQRRFAARLSSDTRFFAQRIDPQLLEEFLARIGTPTRKNELLGSAPGMTFAVVSCSAEALSQQPITAAVMTQREKLADREARKAIGFIYNVKKAWRTRRRA